jgi:hypothetical protein
VLNSPAIVRWNIEKTYLRALDEAGAPSVPTLWRDTASAEAIAEAFDDLRRGGNRREAASRRRAPGVRRGSKRASPLPAADQLPPAACMLQPFLPSIPEEGEYSLMVFRR